MGKIITDNLAYVRTVQEMGMRDNAKNTDLSDILPEDIEEKVKEAAEISMGTEISEQDMLNIRHLCHQVQNLFQTSIEPVTFNFGTFLIISFSEQDKYYIEDVLREKWITDKPF